MIKHNEAKEAGKFKELSKVAWVLFIKGEYAGTAETREGVYSIRPDEVGHIYQPNAEKKEIRMGGPKSVKKTVGA
jgi:hypothetical protein